MSEVIQERSLDGKIGYVQGFRTGWSMALGMIRSGSTVDDAFAEGQRLSEIIAKTVEDKP